MKILILYLPDQLLFAALYHISQSDTFLPVSTPASKSGTRATIIEDVEPISGSWAADIVKLGSGVCKVRGEERKERRVRRMRMYG
jgi:hypothetical protein